MVIHGIDTRDISVVVQGAIAPGITELCLSSIREHLPEAEIILSTWKGSNVEGLEYDQVVFSEDPGTFDELNVESSKKSNLNRQIVSTSEGLKLCQRKYAIKFRTDFVFESADFLKWAKKYPKRNKKFSIFDEKVLCCELYARNPRYQKREARFVMHPSDFFYFGLTKDVKNLFDIPLMSQEEMFYYSNISNEFTPLLPQYMAEQFIWTSFLKKYIHDESLLPKHSNDISPKLIKLTEATFAANLIILSPHELGIACFKPQSMASNHSNCFTHFDWKCLYEYYCKHNPIFFLIYWLRMWVYNAQDTLKIVAKKVIKSAVQRAWRFAASNPWVKKSGFCRTIYGKCKYIYHKNLRKQKKYVLSFFREDVTDQNLSIVLQGPVSSATKESIQSIRKYLPNAELILSTWEGTNLEGLDYDICVINKDPGANGLIRQYPHIQPHNVNRQIVSSFGGIQKATRRYCMKLRSDMIITSTDFLQYYNVYAKYIGVDAMVSRRIMADGLSTSKDGAFSISDWWYLGLTTDLYRLFNIPLYTEDDASYFDQKENSTFRPKFADAVCRYNPEEYIIEQYIKKYGNKSLAIQCYRRHFYDNRAELVSAYHKFIADNFMLFEFTKTGVVLPKARNVDIPVTYSFTVPGGTWLELCNSMRTLPSNIIDKELIEQNNEKVDNGRRNFSFQFTKFYSAIVKNYAKFNVEKRECDGNIDKADITFIVYGKVNLDRDFSTHKCLESIRRFYVKSKIILVTNYEHSQLDYLKKMYDEVLFVDPKNHRHSGSERQAKINFRQTIISQAMCKVQTKYVAVLPADTFLINDHLLRFYVKWINGLNQCEQKYHVFKQRVLVWNRCTHNPRMLDGAYAYSISTDFQFGLKEDMQKLWDGQQVECSDATFYKNQSENPEKLDHQYTTEQLFLLNVLKKAKLNIPYPKYYCDNSTDAYTFEAEKVYASNILVGDNRQLGLCSKHVDENQAIYYTLELLLEKYLYNVDPDNQQCLEYLREHYAEQQLQQVHTAQTVGVLRVVRRCVAATLRGVRKIITGLMRHLLPSYRVACNIRDHQMTLAQVETDQFNYLVHRLNMLDQNAASLGESQKEQLKLIEDYVKKRRS